MKKKVFYLKLFKYNLQQHLKFKKLKKFIFTIISGIILMRLAIVSKNTISV